MKRRQFLKGVAAIPGLSWLAVDAQAEPEKQAQDHYILPPAEFGIQRIYVHQAMFRVRTIEPSIKYSQEDGRTVPIKMESFWSPAPRPEGFGTLPEYGTTMHGPWLVVPVRSDALIIVEILGHGEQHFTPMNLNEHNHYSDVVIHPEGVPLGSKQYPMDVNTRDRLSQASEELKRDVSQAIMDKLS